MRPEANTPSPLRVIVSGGIGSGKSTVIEMLHSMNAVVIEADRIGHEVLEPGGPAYQEVAQRWPSVVEEGRINRSLLAMIVFSDGEQLVTLEAMTHPHIRAEIENRVEVASDRDVVVELPLASDLMGSGWVRLVVDAPREIRLQRIVARGMAEHDAVNRLRMQPTRDEWIGGADIVVENSGSLAALEIEVRDIWERLHDEADA
ncbi:MAG: dephospho-CoA kinase [Actinomycetota bacterium]|nr:dephospho-CoA kinase [Actinomycetota bacterium]